MIRLVKKDGSSYEATSDEIPFIEYVNDLDGTIGRVLLQPEPGVLLEVHPGGEDAARYEALMKKRNIRFADMIIKQK